VIQGHVLSEAGAVAGAVVRVQGSPESVLTDPEGRFELPAPSARPVVLTAWKAGFVIGSTTSSPQPSCINLHALPAEDNPDYTWVDPTPLAEDHQRCGNCHPEIHQQWQSGVHARTATNRRMLSLYAGTDWRGRPGQGWSLLEEHPLGAGVCQSCHAPTVEFGEPGSDDLRLVDGVAAQGVHCDFCHKVHSIPPAESGLAHGRLAVNLLRPEHGQLFFGPLDDVSRGEETYSPLMRESRFCATCHEGVVFGTHLYATYSEWLASPAGQQGQTCQSCHMRPDGHLRNIAPNAGGIRRDPQTLASHQLMPGGKQAMLQRCLSVSPRWSRDADGLRLEVTLLADNVGHRVPTGFIDRHLILSVEPLFIGESESAERIPAGDPPQVPPSDLHVESADRTRGPRLPAEVGKPLAGRPGLLLGRVLTDNDGRSPAPFWRPTKNESDTRLFPGKPLTSEYRFAVQPARVRIRLLYRRFWQEVRIAKSWPDETLVVHDLTIPCQLEPHSP
jgi:hypothetical protein